MTTTTKSQIPAYLQMVAGLYGTQPNLHGFVLQHGRPMPIADHARAFPRAGKMKECFMNAHRYALRHKLTYCEGFSLGVIPVHHAWCMTSEGEVIDPTWENGEEYLGIPFRKAYVFATAMRRGYYGILDDYENGFPLIRGEHPASDFLA